MKPFQNQAKAYVSLSNASWPRKAHVFNSARRSVLSPNVEPGKCLSTA